MAKYKIKPSEFMTLLDKISMCSSSFGFDSQDCKTILEEYFEIDN